MSSLLPGNGNPLIRLAKNHQDFVTALLASLSQLGIKVDAHSIAEASQYERWCFKLASSFQNYCDLIVQQKILIAHSPGRRAGSAAHFHFNSPASYANQFFLHPPSRPIPCQADPRGDSSEPMVLGSHPAYTSSNKPPNQLQRPGTEVPSLKPLLPKIDTFQSTEVIANLNLAHL